MKINGSHYNITPANLTNYTVCGPGPMYATIINGNIVGTSLLSPGVQLDIYMPGGIDSVQLYQESSGSGWIYNFAFAGACPGNVVATAMHDTLCVGDTLNLFAPDTLVSSSVTYAWTGPGGFSPTIQNPFINGVTAADSGLYTVSANDTGGCTYTSSLNVVVTSSPTTLSVSSNSPVCVGDSLHLYATSPTAGSYNWSGPGPFSNGTQNPSIAPFLFNDTGYYVITASNFCGSKIDSVHVIAKNPAAATITCNNPACTGQTLNLSASSATSGVTYQWHGPNSFNVSGSANTSRTNMVYIDSGYYVSTVTLSGCSTSDSVLVHVNPTPATPTAANNGPVCAGDTLKLSSTCATSGVSYNWSGPASIGPSIQNPDIISATPANSGLYTVTTTLNGCSSSATTSALVNPLLGPPTVTITANPGDTICLGASATFLANTTNAGSASYQWKDNGADVPGATGPSFLATALNNGDIISCEVRGNLACQPVDSNISNALHISVISNVPPTVSLTVQSIGSVMTFTANVSGNSNVLSYKWLKNGIFTGQTTSTYSSSNISLSDSICVIVYTSVPCTFPDSVISCYLVTGINNLPVSQGNIDVYPNPVSNELIIDGAEKGDRVLLLNIIGQEVYTGEVSGQKEIIDTHKLNRGNYFLEIISSSGERTIRKIAK